MMHELANSKFKEQVWRITNQHSLTVT